MLQTTYLHFIYQCCTLCVGGLDLLHARLYAPKFPHLHVVQGDLTKGIVHDGHQSLMIRTSKRFSVHYLFQNL